MPGNGIDAKAARGAGLGNGGFGGTGAGNRGWSGPTGVRGAGGFMSPNGTLAQRADIQALRSGRLGSMADAAAQALAGRVTDYRNGPGQQFGSTGVPALRPGVPPWFTPQFDDP